MKEMLNKYVFLIACLLVGLGVAAQGGGGPSPPVGLPTPSPPPGLPIEDGVVVLFMGALLFGFYKIYISIVKKKRSV